MASNPSHILMARNSRGTSNPSASLSSPSETHAAASGIFRSSRSEPWLLEECEADETATELDSSEDEEEAVIDVDETFTKASRYPGSVKIIVENTTFWAHKEVLFFASPFFEAALSGQWAETGRPHSMSSVITISQPPSVPGDKIQPEAPTDLVFAPFDDMSSGESDAEDLQTDVEKGPSQDSGDSEAEPSINEEKIKARDTSLAKLLQSNISSGSEDKAPVSKTLKPISSLTDRTTRLSVRRGGQAAHAVIKRRARSKGPQAIISLKEEKASTFHDFLKFVYPHLDCTIAWNNVEGLMNISHKLCVPSLQNQCADFLRNAAGARPIKALRIAELFEIDDLYREASRFVLDNPGGWSEQEMGSLSYETLLKLEKRRTWFLERVLKLGQTAIAKEYQCCPTCPDPTNCAKLLDEKWRQAYNACFRFGPCQPSMVYRYLRLLDGPGISPPLALSHLTCQNSAKSFVMTLFDRMFSLGSPGSGADIIPVNSRMAPTSTASTQRYFLYCLLKNDVAPRTKKSKDII